MNKKLLITLGILGIFLASAGVYALVNAGNGTYYLTENELAGLTNQQIASYMQSSFTLQSAYIEDSAVKIKYNLVHISQGDYTEQTGSEDYKYKVYNKDFIGIITPNKINECLTNYTLNECVNILVTNTNSTAYEYNSTYLQAFEKGLEEYNRAIFMKNEILEQSTLNNFLGAIQ